MCIWSGPVQFLERRTDAHILRQNCVVSFFVSFFVYSLRTMIQQRTIRVNTTTHDRAFSHVSVYRDDADSLNKKDISFSVNEVLQFVAD